MRIKFELRLPGGMDRLADGALSEAFLRGVKDGLATPAELTSGMTYPDDAGRNEAYDEGANLGQAVGRLYGGVPHEETT